MLHGHEEVGADNWLAKLINLARIRHIMRVGDFQQRAISFQDLIGDIWSRLHEIQVGFLLQTLLDDLHVQQSEEAAAKTKPEGLAALGGEVERRIVDRQFLQRISQLFKVVPFGGRESAVDHPQRSFVARQRRRQRVARTDDRVADVHLLDIFNVADQIPHLTGDQFVAGPPLGDKLAQFQNLVSRAGLQEADFLAAFDRAIDQPDIGDGPAVAIVVAVKNHGAEDSLWIASGRRHSLDDCC